MQRLEGKTLSYKITGFSDNEITVEVLSQNIEVENNESNWEAAVEWLRNKAPKHSNAEMPQHLKNVLLDCLVDSFINDGLLEDITQTINENPQSLSTYLALFIKAKWNSAFVSPEHALEAQFFGKLKKHKESSLALFRSLFASGVSAEEIVNFYMKTIYKAIVPFDLLLAMDNKETMLSALSNQAIFCRLREGEKRAQGRLVNICSSPVCNVSGVENYHDYATVRTTVSDFFTINGSVFRINLKIAARESLTREERGELFAYFSRNIEVNNSRRRFAERFPDSAVYDIREMSFNMKCLEEAVWLRRFNDDALLDLISILGDKNLFRFRASAREEACYLHLCMRDTEPSTVLNLAEQIILNASSSSDVSDIYLNTHIKFFIHIPQLLTLISARNAALCRSEGDMFGGRVFLGAVSERGMLWSPYLPQGIMVDERYKNSAVEFSVSVDRGTASVSVLKEADPREGLFEVIKLLRMGRALNEEIKPFIKRALSGYEKLSVDTLNDAERFLQEGIKALIRDEAERRRKPNLARHKAEVEAFIAAQKREPQPPQEYGEKIARYVERCRFSVSLEDMEELLSSLSEELIKTLSFEEFTEFYMMVFPNYSYNFRDNGLVHIWERQIAEHYGEAAACEFMERMKQNKRYKKNC